MPLISAKQIRAARGLLDWPQKTMASKSGIGVATLRLIEKCDSHITSTSALKIRQALEDAGLEFYENDGVAYRKDSVNIYRNIQALDMLYDLFSASKDNKKAAHIICKSSHTLDRLFGLEDCANFKRFERISKQMTVQCLLTDTKNIFQQKLAFSFRMLNGLFATDTCHILADNKYIIAVPQKDGGYTYLMLKYAGQHDAFYAEFKPAWDRAVPVPVANTSFNDVSDVIAV